MRLGLDILWACWQEEISEQPMPGALDGRDPCQVMPSWQNIMYGVPAATSCALRQRGDLSTGHIGAQASGLHLLSIYNYIRVRGPCTKWWCVHVHRQSLPPQVTAVTHGKVANSIFKAFPPAAKTCQIFSLISQSHLPLIPGVHIVLYSFFQGHAVHANWGTG